MKPRTAEANRLRSRRVREIAGKSTLARRLTKTTLRVAQAELDADTAELGPLPARTTLRSECCYAERPCPWLSCRHHLYLDVTIGGSIRFNFPDLEPEQLTESCSLDVADRGGATLERVGEIMNLTRERVRQVENIAVAKVAESGLLKGWSK